MVSGKEWTNESQQMVTRYPGEGRHESFLFNLGLWKLEKKEKNHSCGLVFDFSQPLVPLVLGQPHHLPAPDLTKLRLAWQEVLKGCRQKSSVVEHAVLTARVFSHTCPIKNLGPSWINYNAAFPLQQRKMLCAPAGGRLLLGSWHVHLAQRLNLEWCSSALSRWATSLMAATVYATGPLPESAPNAQLPIDLCAWNLSSLVTYPYIFMMSAGWFC